MNKFIGIGRLTKNPTVTYSQGAEPMAIARYSLAVNRRFKKDGQPDADFLNIVAFGKNGEFAEKWLKKGIQIAVVGRIQTGSYTNKDGNKVYTTDIVAEEQHFTEKKAQGNSQPTAPKDKEGFVAVDEMDNSDLPF